MPNNTKSGSSTKATAAAILAIFLLAASGLSRATVLVFNEDAPGDPTTNGQAVPQEYGDNVASAAQGGYTYGSGTEGFTPNVGVTYGAGTFFWTTDYGDLTNVVYVNNGGILEITLAATSGFLVDLYSFDIAGWPDSDYTINSVSVDDGIGGALFSQSNVSIEGDGVGPGHSTFEFLTPLSAASLVIRFDSSNLGGLADNIGIDNIRFGEHSLAAVNAPAAGLCMVLAGMGLFAQRRLKGA